MTELVLRALFVLACASIGYQATGILPEGYRLWGILAGIASALIFIVFEIMLGKRPIQSISSIIFGLITGSLLAIIFYNIFILADPKDLVARLGVKEGNEQDFRLAVLLSLTIICCYLCMMVIYRTRDRFRFIIPYVEFQKEEKSTRPIIIDTSVVIDGRLADLCATGVFDGTLILPKFVLQELQRVADSSDRLRRNRGRRGLEMLQRLQRDDRIAVQVHDGRSARGSTVDSKLVSLAGQLQARVLTCDYNLAKIAGLQSVDTVNLNDLANALRPIALPGEDLNVQIIRPGDEAGQGVGYLSDGTMVVVEQGRERIGQTVGIVVTSTLQTNAGRMMFGRIRSDQSGRANHDRESPGKKGDRQG